MRSPGVVYRRYRQIKRKILFDKIQESRKKKHENCVYGKILKYTDSHGYEKNVKLCLYNCEKNKNFSEELDVCTCPISCNAFVSKWTKEAVAKNLEQEFNDLSIKNERYPELSLCEWILDKSLHDAQLNPGWVGNLIVKIITFLENLLKNISENQKNL